MAGGLGSDIRGRKFGGKGFEKRLPHVGRLAEVFTPSSSKRVWPRLRTVGAQSPTKIAVSRLPLVYKKSERRMESRGSSQIDSFRRTQDREPPT